MNIGSQRSEEPVMLAKRTENSKFYSQIFFYYLVFSLYEKSDSSARLNDTNYYSMCKLLLQMEDETDSKRSLRHDQYNRKVKQEFGKRYSLHIVNKNSQLFFSI